MSYKRTGGQVFILLLPQAAVLPGSDAGSGGVEPASGFVIRNRQISCYMWCSMCKARYQDVVCGLFRGAALTIVKERDLICAWTNGIAQHQSVGVELNLGCLRQAHSNRPGTGRGNENMDSGSILSRVPFMVNQLRRADAKYVKAV